MVEAKRIGILVEHQDLRQFAMPIEDALRNKCMGDLTEMVVIYAGQNPLKLHALRNLLPANKVIGENADPEPLAHDVSQVALHKVGVVHNRRPNDLGTNAIIGIDILTRIPLIEGSEVVHKQHGKIGSPFEVPKHFSHIYEASEKFGLPPGYSVVTHTALLHRNGKLMLFEAPSSVEIVLSQAALKYLTTNEGLLQYLMAFHHVYYGTLNPKMALEKISAGIDLLALVQMGAIESINGISSRDNHFAEVLRNAAFIVTVGISPKILELLGVSQNQVISQGSFIDEITELALKRQ